MGQGYLIDTNILVDVLGNAIPDNVKQKVLQIAPVVSVVTYIEAMGMVSSNGFSVACYPKVYGYCNYFPN